MWTPNYRAYSDGMSACDSVVLRYDRDGVSLWDRVRVLLIEPATRSRPSELCSLTRPHLRHDVPARQLGYQAASNCTSIKNSSVQRDRAAHERAYQARCSLDSHVSGTGLRLGQTRSHAWVNLHSADEMPPSARPCVDGHGRHLPAALQWFNTDSVPNLA
jgi:hypothetical protein